MKSKFFFSLLFLLTLFCRAQNTCKAVFIKDTLFLPMESKTVTGEYLEAVLKNRSVVRLFKTNTNRYYLKLFVTENLYFEKIDQLEVQSGSKSFYEPKIKQYELNKSTGFYIFEILKNYVGTLKDEGITSIIFGKAVTNFSRQDVNQIKQISKCLYETIIEKK